MDLSDEALKRLLDSGHAKGIEAPLIHELRQARVQSQVYKDSADLWSTRWSRLKENFEKLEKENASLREKKVGIPRLLEALATSPGAEERKALVDRIKELEAQVNAMVSENEKMMLERNGFAERAHIAEAQVEELKLDIQKVIASDSSEIAEAKRLISEMSAMEIGGHKVGDIYDHMKKVANQKAGNPWAPNQDYPGKPV